MERGWAFLRSTTKYVKNKVKFMGSCFAAIRCVVFERHDASCLVAWGAEDAAHLGLMWLARQQLDKINMCNDATSDLLRVGSADLADGGLDLLPQAHTDVCTVVQPATCAPCPEVLKARRALTRLRHAVQIAEAKEDARWMKLTMRQERRRTAMILARVMQSLSFGVLDDAEREQAGATFDTFTAWYEEGLSRAAVERLIRAH